jgi:hypothetical protein
MPNWKRTNPGKIIHRVRSAKNVPRAAVRLCNEKGEYNDCAVVNHQAHLLRELGNVRFLCLLNEAAIMVGQRSFLQFNCRLDSSSSAKWIR